MVVAKKKTEKQKGGGGIYPAQVQLQKKSELKMSTYMKMQERFEKNFCVCVWLGAHFLGAVKEGCRLLGSSVS